MFTKSYHRGTIFTKPYSWQPNLFNNMDIKGWLWTYINILRGLYMHSLNYLATYMNVMQDNNEGLLMENSDKWHGL